MAGGIDWFRWHHGCVTDPKFQLVARKAGASLPDVLAVWAYLLEKASAAEFRGCFGELDCEAIDCLFDLNEGVTEAILSQMVERKLISDEYVVAWEKRQPKREREGDNSTARVQAHRAMKRHETPAATKPNPETPRGEERREEPSSPPVKKKRVRDPDAPCPEDVSQQVWTDWLALRRKKSAPVTATVVEGAITEAAKAGLSLDAFLRIWVTRGSQGFSAEWIKPHERPAAAPTESAYARQMREKYESIVPSVAAKKPGTVVPFTIEMEPTDGAARLLG